MDNMRVGSSWFTQPSIDDPLQSLLEFNDLAERSSLGFMELLGFQDLNPSPLLDTTSTQSGKIKKEAVKPELGSSDLLNPPATPISSSISDAVKEEDEKDEESQKKSSIKKEVKGKKGSQKRQREQRVAFMTESKVDHLEDGYRWRKYGQKAVKNSPFPRSYYRCTTTSCNVKKRVERSFTDPAIVVTTYEGQHTHPSPLMFRPGSHLGPSNSLGRFGQQYLLQHQQNQQQFIGNAFSPMSYGYRDGYAKGIGTESRLCSPVSSGLTKDEGLLQDVVPSHVFKEEW